MTRSISQFAVPGVQGLSPYVAGKPLGELEREYGIENAIKLASNENPGVPSSGVVKAVSAALPELARYPDGNGFELKAALSERLNVPVDWITLGNGSNDILESVARTFLSAGTEAVFSEHAFAIYPIVTQATGAAARIAKAHDGSRGPAWGHDLDAMAKQVTAATRVVFVANPNNPTGTWLARGELKAFVENLPESVIVVMDEAYFEFVDKVDYPDALEWLGEHENLLVTRTFSKAYGLAGLRVGYGVANPELTDLLNRVRQPFNVNHLAQVAALAALSDEAYLQESVRANRAGLAALENGFKQLGLGYIPSAGNFICFDVGAAADAVYEGLLREGVIVRPLANYGMSKHLRVSVGLPEENLRFLDALGKVIH